MLLLTVPKKVFGVHGTNEPTLVQRLVKSRFWRITHCWLNENVYRYRKMNALVVD